MNHKSIESNKHQETSISKYLLVWVSLLVFTSITVTIAGLNLGSYALLIAVFIAIIKSSLVINIFMHIKYEEFIFKVFLAIGGFTLMIIFLLTFFDYTYR